MLHRLPEVQGRWSLPVRLYVWLQPHTSLDCWTFLSGFLAAIMDTATGVAATETELTALDATGETKPFARLCTPRSAGGRNRVGSGGF